VFVTILPSFISRTIHGFSWSATHRASTGNFHGSERVLPDKAKIADPLSTSAGVAAFVRTGKVICRNSWPSRSPYFSRKVLHFSTAASRRFSDHQSSQRGAPPYSSDIL